MHHEIEIKVNGNEALPPNPLPSMNIKDTVHYSSKDGKVKVVFPGRSPFRTDDVEMTEVTDTATLIVQQEGTFNCRCFVEVGWRPGSPSGGVHNVGGG